MPTLRPPEAVLLVAPPRALGRLPPWPWNGGCRRGGWGASSGTRPSGLHERKHSVVDLEHNKQTVVAFYTRAFNDHQPADAVAKYVGPEYIQHNPDTPSGTTAFVQSTIGLIDRFPQVSVEIKRVIAEGD